MQPLNCFAFTLGELSTPRQPKLIKVLDATQPFASVSEMYAPKGYTLSQQLPLRPDAFRNTGKPKIVVYGIVEKGKVVEFTHAAIQESDGKWTSKLGDSGPLIRHESPYALDGGSYGEPVAIYEQAGRP